LEDKESNKKANKKAAQSAGRLGGEACITALRHEKIMHNFNSGVAAR
jgi:hypothetical protein